MSTKTIFFEFNGSSYRVDKQVYFNNMPISLPTGEVLKASAWTKSEPRKPLDIHHIGHTSTYTPETILAERIESQKEMSGVDMKDMMIRFKFDDVEYEVPPSVYEKDARIKLPDGTLLVVDTWKETAPPVPFSLRIVEPIQYVDAVEVIE
jgi:hypothetical protein